MKSYTRIITAVLAVVLVLSSSLQIGADSLAIDSVGLSEQERHREQEFIKTELVDSVVAYLKVDYNEIIIPGGGDNLQGWYQRMLRSEFGPNNFEVAYRYMKSRTGREVRTYDGTLFRRITVSLLTTKNDVICDSIWNMVLKYMWVIKPHIDSFPKIVKFYIPTVIIKGSNYIFLLSTRGEDLLDDNATKCEFVFWEMAEYIASLVENSSPEWVLGCGIDHRLKKLGNP